MSTQPPPSALNRRAVPRHALRQAATVVHGDVTLHVRTSDIGRDGMCLLTPKPISPGTRCKATFEVPLSDGPKTVTASLRVVYSSYSGADGFKIGAVFTDLDEDLAAIIGRFAMTY